MTKAERTSPKEKSRQAECALLDANLAAVAADISTVEMAASLREVARDPEYGYTAQTLRVCRAVAARFSRKAELSQDQLEAFLKACDFPETPRCPECKRDLS